MAINAIVWDDVALQDLTDIISFIAMQSPANADMIAVAIEQKLQTILRHPEMCAPDKYKVENDGAIRAFEMHNIRITYAVEEYQLVIVRVRSTHLKPLLF